MPSSSLASEIGSVVVGVGAFAAPRSRLSPKGPDVALMPSAGGFVETGVGAATGAGGEEEAPVDLEGSVGEATGYPAEVGNY